MRSQPDPAAAPPAVARRVPPERLFLPQPWRWQLVVMVGSMAAGVVIALLPVWSGTRQQGWVPCGVAVAVALTLLSSILRMGVEVRPDCSVRLRTLGIPPTKVIRGVAPEHVLDGEPGNSEGTPGQLGASCPVLLRPGTKPLRLETLGAYRRAVVEREAAEIRAYLVQCQRSAYL